MNNSFFSSHSLKIIERIIYGLLYNFPVVTDARGICPAGWRVATDDDWSTLITQCGGSSVAGGRLKEIGFLHWNSPNTGAFDTYLFSARAGGYRLYNGGFQFLGAWASFLTSTVAFPGYARYVGLSNTTISVDRGPLLFNYGLPLRLIKNDSTDPLTLTDRDGNVYRTAKIGNQVWTAENYCVTHYNNGDLIPNVSVDADWTALAGVSGGCCAYANNALNVKDYGPYVQPKRILQIGDAWEGGIIGYLLRSYDAGYDANVQHGLIVSIADINPAGGLPWGMAYNDIVTGTAVGIGRANTTNIMNRFGIDEYAACYADQYGGGGFWDWYLPSSEELRLLIANRAILGMANNVQYWSSSQNDIYYGMSISYDSTVPALYYIGEDKLTLLRVRAVRSF